MKCADCDLTADYELAWITGESDPAKNHYGFRLTFGLCEEHMAELVRTTDKRFEFKALTKAGRKARGMQGQQSWEF